ncbi:hypothetical protein U8335_09895 [Roseiconus lacunae]|nr:hypothetical protein U8335_09895 [Stieleria sp. HD01]
MSKPVDIVLGGAANGHRKDTFANQFVDAVSNAIWASRVANVLGNRTEQSEPMFGVAKQDDSGMGVIR